MMNILLQIWLQIWRRLLSLTRRGRLEREMEEEMRFHLEMQIEQNLGAGMSPGEARFAAQRQFGNQTWLKGASHEMWSLNSIETLIHDLRYGARRLMRNPGFTLIAMLTLALGIGANTAIFSPLSAIGKQIRASQMDDWREVVGVVGDIRQDGMDKEAPTYVYWPILVARFQGNSDVEAQRSVTFSIRGPRAGSESLMYEIRQAVWSVAPYLPLAEVRTLNDNYTRSMARTSFPLVMLAIAGSMALFLGIVGFYGVIAYSVSQRRREIGIHMAMGAGKSAVLKTVISQGMKLALIGVAIGLAGALGLTRFLSGLLYGVRPSDPPTLVAVSALLIAVALFASYVPARRAVKVDPMVALRHE